MRIFIGMTKCDICQSTIPVKEYKKKSGEKGIYVRCQICTYTTFAPEGGKMYKLIREAMTMEETTEVLS